MSEIKVNKISPRSGTTVTLGDSGDTFTIPSGATINNQGTAVNFGATGSASWVTTVKTGDFTAVAGEGYFVNTTSGEITVTLPGSPSAGAVVAVKDYANTFDTNKCTLARNGSNIGGAAVDATLSTEGLAVTLVYVDATKGWLVTDSGLQSEAPAAEYVTATGGTVLTNGNFKTHVFTGPGTFTVSCAGNPFGSSTVDYMVVAGGGGSAVNGGGGGAGGFRISNSVGCVPAPTMSPLIAPAGLPVSAQAYPIVVGGGGTAAGPFPSTINAPGAASSFSTISSAGGGEGSDQCVTSNGGPGGSGGGARTPGGTQGTGNTPPVSPPQGNPGGPLGCSPNAWSSGGGAAAAGTSAAPQVGGIGSFTADSVFGPTAPSYGTPGPVSSTRYFAGGGGGANQGPTSASTHAGGAGGGGTGAAVDTTNNTDGTTNTGGGAGSGNGGLGRGRAGGSGIVIVRYKFQ